MAFEKIIDIPRLNRFKTKILNLVYQKGDVYNKNEIDNKFSQLETNIDWKEAVATYNDIATTYPNPVDGWTVNVKDTDYTYRYNGTSWVAISANAIPKATQSVDGLITKEDKTKLDGIATGAEVNQNAFSKVTVGSTTVAADNKTDTLTLVAGSNVTITPDATNDKITIAATDTKYSSKAAVSGGTDVSLVTTGEKATWNAKTSNTGTITQVKANGTSIATSGVANIPAASTSAYGVTKLTSDLTGNSESLAATQKAVNELNSNLIKVATSLQNITVNSNSEREYTFDFSNIHTKEIILQFPIIYSNGLGISVGRNISKNYTVKLWNNTSSNRDVSIIYYLLYR